MDVTRTDNFMGSMALETYRVGGSVRDELIGRPVKDADYMVRGRPLRALGFDLKEALDAGGWPTSGIKPLILRDGRQAGWRVSGRGLGAIEIVLPRTEVSTGPGHRDFEIKVDPEVTLEEDCKRRDFTFNALYRPIGPSGALRGYTIDPTQRGLYDLEHKLVQTTHADSFRDDPLRTLRALRFVSTLGYDLSGPTTAQMFEHCDAVTGLSANGYASGTVLEEMNRILMGPDAVKALRLARDTGVLAVLFPELAPMLGFDQGSRWHDLTTDEHTFKAMETAIKVEAPLRVRWALLFHDSGKPETAWTDVDGHKHYYSARIEQPKDVIRMTEDHEVASERLWRAAAARLSMPAKLRDEVATLVREHMVPIKVKNPATRVRRWRVKFGDEMLRDLLLHRMCDLTGKGTSSMPALESIAKMERIRQEAHDAGVPSSVKDLEINGRDLIELGIEGREIGRILAVVLDEAVCQPDERTLTRFHQLARATKEARRG